MEIAKALILAGPEPQHLFPVANRPILFHNLEALRAAGVLEAAIFADRRTVGTIERAVGDGRDWGLSVSCAEWDPNAGVGGALAAGRCFIGDEPVLVQRGDAVLHERLHGHISAFARERLDALGLRVPEAMPWCLLSPRAISVLGAGRAQAMNLVSGVRAQGGRVRVQDVDGCVPRVGDPDALLEGNRRLLERVSASHEPCSVEDSRIEGAVQVHPTARIRRSVVRGPVVIGPGARLTDAYVGPYTSIGSGVVVEASEIEHSIVLPDAELRYIATRLESSVIGRGARVVRGFEVPRTIRVSLADGAEVVLP
jgi:glucose-1-phosphate thymidylyltransferase